ncbi:MAG: TRAP transporter large permease subunit, partial [Burkholderiales bacterium]
MPGTAAGDARWLRRLALPLALASVGFHLWLIFSGLIPNLVSRPVHMALALPWVFLFERRAGRVARASGALLCGLGLAACAWIVLRREALDEQYGALQGTLQFVIAGTLIVVVLDMARRAIKLALPTIALLALGYGFFGQYLPGEFGHPGIPAASLLGTLTIAEGGLWGPLTGVSVNVVAVFVMLGAFVGAGRGGTGFMALATWLAGGLRAGAAKVAVLASALFGS